MNHWLHMWTTDTTCETFNLLCEILTIWEPLTLLVKHSSYLWTTDTTCETFILLVNRWHYLWNIYPTCESLTSLVKHLLVTHWATCATHYFVKQQFSTDTLVNHWSCLQNTQLGLTTWWTILTHTCTHTHTMPRHRTGKAAYLTTILNTQQRTSLQYSTPNRWFPLVSSQTKSVASVFCNQIFHKRPNLWGFPQCRNKE